MATTVEPRIDIAPANPLRLILQMSDGSLADLAARAGDNDMRPADRVVRIQAMDLRATCRRTAALHAEAAARGDAVAVLVDLEVVIDHDAQQARESLAVLEDSRTPKTLRYVGTATGLAGLVADIHALQLADGVALLPLTALSRDLMFDEALPHLATMGIDTTRVPIHSVQRSRSDQHSGSWSGRIVDHQ